MPNLKSLLMLLAVTVVAAGATLYIKENIYQINQATENAQSTSTVADIDSPPNVPVEEPEVVVMPPTEPVVTNPPIVPAPQPPVLAGACVVGGCSSQLCGEAAEMADIVTTCEYRPIYSCYQAATCERQTTGKCGWTETPALAMCLKANS